eukprot:m.80727 g.80727  ORF g.80727 m.80727 type:complete len:273 (-) comp25342_c0_seq4:614-1432(-)
MEPFWLGYLNFLEIFGILSCGSSTVSNPWEARVRPRINPVLRRIPSTVNHKQRLGAHDPLLILRRSLDISPDGSKIISGSQDGSVKLWDVCSDQTFSISTFVGGHHYGVLDAKFHPTTASTFASVGREGSIRMWDTRVQSAPTAVHSLSQPACSFLFTSGMLITGHLDGTVAFYDERNMGLSLQECNTQTNAVNVLRSSATGLVAAGSDDCSVVVYSAKKAKREGATSSDGGLVVHSDSTHSDFVRSVHWTNETKFVTGSWDGQVLEHEVKL